MKTAIKNKPLPKTPSAKTDDRLTKAKQIMTRALAEVDALGVVVFMPMPCSQPARDHFEYYLEEDPPKQLPRHIRIFDWD